MAVVNSNKKFSKEFIQQLKEIAEREDIFEDLLKNIKVSLIMLPYFC